MIEDHNHVYSSRKRDIISYSQAYLRINMPHPSLQHLSVIWGMETTSFYCSSRLSFLLWDCLWVFFLLLFLWGNSVFFPPLPSFSNLKQNIFVKVKTYNSVEICLTGCSFWLVHHVQNGAVLCKMNSTLLYNLLLFV